MISAYSLVFGGFLLLGGRLADILGRRGVFMAGLVVFSVGSLLCGRRDFVAEARRVRKMFGGGMRQVGVLAAAGLVALRKGPARLPEDHEHAALLARGLAELPGIEIDPAAVRTNIVIFRVKKGTAAPFLARLRERGVLGGPVSADAVRFVTHRDVSRADVLAALDAVKGLAAT